LLRLTAGQRAALRKAARDYKPLSAALGAARQRQQSAEAARQKALAGRKPPAAVRKAEADVLAAQKAILAAEQRLNAFLDRKAAGLDAGPRPFLDRALRSALRDPDLGSSPEVAALLKSAPAARRSAALAPRRHLVALGVAAAGESAKLLLRPVRPGKGAPAGRLTPFEAAQVGRYNAALLAELVLPGAVAGGFQVNFVDQRLTVPKAWRDVYRYDGAGRLLGWTRHGGSRPLEFTAEGLLVLKKDGAGRPLRARSVRYAMDGPFSWTPKPLKQILGDEVVTFAYEGGKVRVRGRERVREGE
jgi:hypothetical protein